MADWEEKKYKMVNARIKLERTGEVIQQMIRDAYELEKKRAPSEIKRAIYINAEIYKLIKGETNIVILVYKQDPIGKSAKKAFLHLAEEFRNTDIIFALYPVDLIEEPDYWMAKTEVTPNIYFVDKKGKITEITMSDILQVFELSFTTKLRKEIERILG